MLNALNPFAPKIEDQLFKLKITVKQLQRMAKKAEKEQNTSKGKTKKAIEQGNLEGARIYAQDAIRHKNEYLNYLKLSSRVDAVASKIEGAVRMGQVSKAMAGAVKGMEAALDQMDVQKISKTMEEFSKQFEDVDVRTNYIESSLSSTTTLTTPEDQVEGLIQQVADENNLQLSREFMEAATTKPIPGTEAQDEELELRLKQLRTHAQ
eukprot:c1208_g1_i1.p1 GENE.c1208_g1_i1~~c1208_g1_i1.p1  ORF type:complete len:208 (-),score=92.75 c1208_g1_i1:82-705(-)